MEYIRKLPAILIIMMDRMGQKNKEDADYRLQPVKQGGYANKKIYMLIYPRNMMLI